MTFFYDGANRINDSMFSRLRDFNEANVIAVLIALTISFSLPYDLISKYTLYVAFYLSIFFIFLRKDNVKNKVFIFSLIIIIFSVFEISWAKLFHSVQYNNIHAHYFNSAKKMIMGAVVLFHLISVKERVSVKTLDLCRYVLIVSCLYLSGYSVYEYLSIKGRVGFGIYATTGSYIYSLQALLTIYIISLWKIKYNSLLLIMFFVITTCSVILTGTRAAMLVYPLCVFILFANRINLKILSAFLFLLLLGFLTKIIPSELIVSRINSTVHEISAYQEDKVSTSLGARFSMWKAGVYIIKNNPYGLSADERNIQARDYIKKNEHGNQAALFSVEYHLHNELINTGSLQGFIGIIFLLTFYISLIYFPFMITRSLIVTMLISLPTIIFGLSDTLFMFNQYVYMMMCTLIMYLLYSYKPDYFRK